MIRYGQCRDRVSVNTECHGPCIASMCIYVNNLNHICKNADRVVGTKPDPAHGSLRGNRTLARISSGEDKPRLPPVTTARCGRAGLGQQIVAKSLRNVSSGQGPAAVEPP